MNSAKKTSVLFICLGNICRSPLAEGIFLHLVKAKGLQDQFYIDSAGTGGYHNGESYHSESIRVAGERGVKLQGVSRELRKEDLKTFDYLITMDQSNYRNTVFLDEDNQFSHKVYPLLNFATGLSTKEVPDPYHGGPDGFDHVFDICENGCIGLLEYILAQKK